PDLIVGFGVLGRLLLRITRALGHPDPTVWEINPERAEAEGIEALTAESDPRKDYQSIYDVSGAAGLLDTLVGSLGKGGTIVLAGFYPGTIQFGFAPAFMKEARLRIAAEYAPEDAHALIALLRDGKMSLDGLISHTSRASEASRAYDTAFTDPSCLKMMLDWRPSLG
ncbi:MAG: chlorophyll synthesis pathway protein BchC, partial [Pseudomonadota bacterium]